MPIGNMYSRISSSKVSSWVIRCLGVLDLHTHIRLRPILGFFREHIQPDSSCRVLEIGCGDGINAFELAKLAKSKGVLFHYCGIDVDPHGLQKAKQMAKTLGLEDHLEFLSVSAQEIASLSVEPSDFVVLADVLEHVETPQTLLKNLRPMLSDKGICLVSVPTHNYERTFGASFHRQVGHIRSGYHLEELNALFATIGGRLIGHSYSTGFISNLGCAVYYRLPATRHATALKALLLATFRFLDIYNSPTVSCSLFAAYSFAH